jgi:predicted AlkP superfamily phosphohydrolase/phosphomutase
LTAGRRVLAIGLDGGEPEWITRWLADGRLPHLAEIARRGFFAAASAPFASLLDAQWVSLTTGTGPGEHGHYFHRQPRSGVVAPQATRNGSYLRPFWAALPGAGRSALVIDVPKTRPVESDSIVQVIGWGEKFPMLRASRPAGLLRELERRFGKHPIGVHAPDVTRERAARRLSERIARGIDQRTQITRSLMGRVPWDLLVTVFAESHIAGHDFFPGARHEGPPDADRRPEREALIRGLYEKVDEALGALVAEAGPEVDVLVFSPHGLDARFDSHGVLGPVLRRLGYLVPPPPRAPDPLDRLRNALPYSLRERINRLLPHETQSALVARFLAGSCDWTRTRAYCEDVTRENQPWIRLNVRGREPFGIVDPGGEYDDLCDEISGELRRFRTVPGGVGAVRAVVRSRVAYPGPHADQLPDLVVEWRERTVISAVEHPRLGVIAGEVPTQRASTHSPRAFLAGCGPSIAPGAALVGPSTLDLAPTILHLLDVPAPARLEGRVLREALRGASLERAARVDGALDLRTDFWAEAASAGDAGRGRP